MLAHIQFIDGRLGAGVTGAIFASCRPMELSLQIAVVEENPLRAEILITGLREAGHRNVLYIGQTQRLLQAIYDSDPDVVIIGLENPSRDTLEQLFQMSRVVKRPIAMFVDKSDRAAITAAIDAGVSAYVVGGLQKERVQSILDVCISRFNAMARMQDELERAKTALEERKVIDRAKGILMRAKGLDEEEAYRVLRKTAMNENKKIAEIAQSVVMAAELLR
jgi:two-component system, response regulator / RNA-binding antiterminator